MKTRSRNGFTLVEISIVVAIVGLLAALAVPSMEEARRKSRVSRFAHDLRIAADSVEVYAMYNGDYPPDAMRGVVPAGMEEYLPSVNWTAPTVFGGRWDWEHDTLGIGAGVSVVGAELRDGPFLDVDAQVDDGNLLTGRFRRIAPNRYTWIIEE